MALIVVQGYNIKRGQEEAHQQWVTDNDEFLRTKAPEGIEYLGTYTIGMSTEKHTGEYRTLFRMGSYAGFDVVEEAARDPESEWGRINRQVTDFMDLPIGAEGSFAVFQSLIGAVIWDIS